MWLLAFLKNWNIQQKFMEGKFEKNILIENKIQNLQKS